MVWRITRTARGCELPKEDIVQYLHLVTVHKRLQVLSVLPGPRRNDSECVEEELHISHEELTLTEYGLGTIRTVSVSESFPKRTLFNTYFGDY